MPDIKIKKVRKYNLIEMFIYLYIRIAVFLLKHNRKVWQEFSLIDFKADHYFFEVTGNAIGIARVLNKDNILELGRIAIKKEYRNKGYGKKCIKKLIDYLQIKKKPLAISLIVAEESLTNYYQQFGFLLDGEVYFNNIPYPRMTINFF